MESSEIGFKESRSILAHNLGMRGTRTITQPTDDDPASCPATIPPYWSEPSPRPPSTISIESENTGINLQDNTTAEGSHNTDCWIRGASIEDHTVVNGNQTSIGAFVAWNICVETFNGGKINIYKRYSEFEILRRDLLRQFPLSRAALPSLPEKSVILKFHPRFLEKRRLGLQYFLNCVFLNPEFSNSPVVQRFIFS